MSVSSNTQLCENPAVLAKRCAMLLSARSVKGNDGWFVPIAAIGLSVIGAFYMSADHVRWRR